MVDAMELLEAAGPAVGVVEVAEGAAFVLQGAAEDALDAARQAGDVGWAERVGGSERMNGGVEEGLIDVNVAQAGDQPLVEQGVLDRSGGAGKAAGEVGGADAQRLGAEIFIRQAIGPQPEDPSKPPRIAESHFLPTEGEDQVGMRAGGSVGRGDAQPAGHAKMDVETVGVIELNDDLLSPPGDARNDTARQQAGEIGPRGMNDVGAVKIDAVDPPAQHGRADGLHGGFNFGKLGHLKLLQRLAVYGLSARNTIQQSARIGVPP